MKKTLILGLILGIFAVPSVSPVQAQSFTPEQQASMDTLRQQLIEILIQQIAVLQAQIAELIEKQDKTNEAIGAVEAKINTSVKATPTASVSSQRASITSVSASCSAGRITMDIETDGNWGQATTRVYNKSGTVDQRSAVLPRSPSQLFAYAEDLEREAYQDEFFYEVTLFDKIVGRGQRISLANSSGKLTMPSCN